MSSVLTYNGHGLKLMTGSGYVRVSGEKYDPTAYPYLLLQCDGYNGSHPNVSSTWTGAGGTCEWSQVSDSPNVWKLEITSWGVNISLGAGLLFLFSSNASPPVGTITNSCRLIGSGNMEATLNGFQCESFDRMFGGCTGLTHISPIQSTIVQNVGGMFQGCTNVEYGALDQYNWFSTYGISINNHSGTFSDCGSSTGPGAADLAQIPVGWGGTLVPVSTLMTSSRAQWKNKYDEWSITANGPDWTSMNGVYVFTEASVSSYAGVSMNRSRIAKFNSLNTASSAALYFYPCFMQHDTGIQWAVTTGTPNGSLTTSQGNTDMPGTLDYSTYGPFSKEFGTYDSAGTVYFCFLVTNEELTSWSQWDLVWKPYGVLYNSNFKTDAGLRWFR